MTFNLGLNDDWPGPRYPMYGEYAKKGLLGNVTVSCLGSATTKTTRAAEAAAVAATHAARTSGGRVLANELHSCDGGPECVLSEYGNGGYQAGDSVVLYGTDQGQFGANQFVAATASPTGLGVHQLVIAAAGLCVTAGVQKAAITMLTMETCGKLTVQPVTEKQGFVLDTNGRAAGLVHYQSKTSGLCLATAAAATSSPAASPAGMPNLELASCDATTPGQRWTLNSGKPPVPPPPPPGRVIPGPWLHRNGTVGEFHRLFMPEVAAAWKGWRRASSSAGPLPVGRPMVWLKATFDAPPPPSQQPALPLALKMGNATKGRAWVNGVELGMEDLMMIVINPPLGHTLLSSTAALTCLVCRDILEPWLRSEHR